MRVPFEGYESERSGGWEKERRRKKKGKRARVAFPIRGCFFFFATRHARVPGQTEREKRRRGNVYRIKFSLCLDNSAVHATIKRICFVVNDGFAFRKENMHIQLFAKVEFSTQRESGV